MNWYEILIKPVMFSLSPETAHNLTVNLLDYSGRLPGLPSLINRLYTTQSPLLKTTVGGIHFENPIGLAAGFDKNARAIPMMESFGFGHLEVGSISAFPARGNPKPRLFRLPIDQGIIVNYGLPNDGAQIIQHRLSKIRSNTPLGINIVSTNNPPEKQSEDQILSDYYQSISLLHPCGDYLCLNLSCPNTAEGRDLFGESSIIRQLLSSLIPLNIKIPVFLKISASRDEAFLNDLVETADSFPFVAGFEINLPSGKPSDLITQTPRKELEHLPGAVSGKPIQKIIDQSLQRLYKIIKANSRFKIIAAGGVITAEDTYRKIKLGASLVQLYTGLIYKGPGLVSEILQNLILLLQKDGFSNVSQAVGVESP